MRSATARLTTLAIPAAVSAWLAPGGMVEDTLPVNSARKCAMRSRNVLTCFACCASKCCLIVFLHGTWTHRGRQTVLAKQSLQFGFSLE